MKYNITKQKCVANLIKQQIKILNVMLKSLIKLYKRLKKDKTKVEIKKEKKIL